MPSPAPSTGPASGPQVRFGGGRTPEAATTVTIEAWEGPLGLLLSLIEARRLDVLTVPLAALTEAYLDALAGLEGDRLGNISAFVSVAGQLILIKSRELLPRRPEVDPDVGADEGLADPEAALRARLLAYRAYRDAGLRLEARAAESSRSFRREPGAARSTALASAAPPDLAVIPIESLAAALAGLVSVSLPPELPAETVRRTISLAERAAVIRAALIEAPSIVLQELLRGVRDRVVVSVTFLALLELMKRREVVVEQCEPFGPIVARRPGAGS